VAERAQQGEFPRSRLKLLADLRAINEGAQQVNLNMCIGEAPRSRPATSQLTLRTSSRASSWRRTTSIVDGPEARVCTTRYREESWSGSWVRMLLLSEEYRPLRPRMLPTPAREKRPDPRLAEGIAFDSADAGCAGLRAPPGEALTARGGMWFDRCASPRPLHRDPASNNRLTISGCLPRRHSV
jgi:hypothetical protein